MTEHTEPQPWITLVKPSFMEQRLEVMSKRHLKSFENYCLGPPRTLAWRMIVVNSESEDIAAMDSNGQLWTAMNALLTFVSYKKSDLASLGLLHAETDEWQGKQLRTRVPILHQWVNAQAEHATLNDLWKSTWAANHKDCLPKLMESHGQCDLPDAHLGWEADAPWSL